jgi:hypothetical protein
MWLAQALLDIDARWPLQEFAHGVGSYKIKDQNKAN